MKSKRDAQAQWEVMVVSTKTALNESGYERRYCYEYEVDARAALKAWDGVEHPSGPWIKCKGAGFDLLNPGLG
ncbi:hypothetical protein LP417_34180 (plasmid) [Polaromonas sp. P1-6]|nr:hypothetical protein LP417_34180 [Polaromonas sp. P1-6]